MIPVAVYSLEAWRGGFFPPKVQSFHAEGWNKHSDAKECLFLLLDAVISLLTAGVPVQASRI